LVFGDVRLNYRQLHERTNRLANAMRALGLAKGDRVAILAENSHRYVELLLAAAKAHLVATPLNFRLTERELHHMLQDSGSRALFVGAGFVPIAAALQPQLPELVHSIGLAPSAGLALDYESLLQDGDASEPGEPPHENDLAMLLYTGGTTGLPKGVMLSHRNLMTAFTSIVIQFQFTQRDTNVPRGGLAGDLPPVGRRQGGDPRACRGAGHPERARGRALHEHQRRADAL
jgi:acyl-CoA synthetase (AMP-forming)/AMP-acid ligase II